MTVGRHLFSTIATTQYFSSLREHPTKLVSNSFAKESQLDRVDPLKKEESFIHTKEV